MKRKKIKKMRALFFGNSYTRRNDLPELVKTFVEAGDPGLSFDYDAVIYGGRTLEHHWAFQSQNILKLPNLTEAVLEAACEDMEAASQHAETLPEPDNKDAGRYRSAIAKQQEWRKMTGENAPSWDYVVLQSWRDTEGGLFSGYAVHTTKFAELARERGMKIVLYNTGPTYQNAEPLNAAPDKEIAVEESRFVPALGSVLDALVIPVPLAIVNCQAERPDLPMRYVNDGHPNQICGYLTACLFYAALFGRSPEGLFVDRVVDNKIVDEENPDVGPDGDPREFVFSDELRMFLQRTAWATIQEFYSLHREG